jgi:hypothetical protein
MSTRASVVVKDAGGKVYLYQHSDGYPDGLGETLKRFLESGAAINHKEDVEYLAAALVAWVNHENIQRGQKMDLVCSADGVHGDESFQYVIDADTLDLTTYSRADGFAYRL